MKVRLMSHVDADGFGCNVIANLYFGEDNVVATNHNYDKIDSAVMDFLHSNEVKDFGYLFITDLSVSDETAERIDKYIKSGQVLPQIVLLDHHKSAERLNKYDWCHVSETRKTTVGDYILTCGTEIFFFWVKNNIPDEALSSDFDFDYYFSPTLQFVKLVRDWDTWRWKTVEDSCGQKSKELNDLFTIYGPEKFVSWACEKIKYDYKPELSFRNDWSDTEKFLLANRAKEIEDYVKQKNAHLIVHDFRDTGFPYIGGVVFADRFISELGNKLCELHPELDCAVIVNLSSQVISFRAVKEEVDISKLAEKFGGGGHKLAAGSQVSKNFTSSLVDSLFSYQKEGA